MHTLYLIRGLPGSGKSSFALELWKTDFVDVFYEADQYFTIETGEYRFDTTKIASAHEWCQRKVRQALLNGSNVAVSNTSTTEKEVEVYRKMAEDCGAQFISLIVENRHGNKSVHDVPEVTLERMKNRFSIKL